MCDKVFIIAEMSGNHNGSLERALEIVEVAAQTGVHAVKLQTYTADTMTLDIKNGDFVISDPDSLWSGRNLYELYNEAYTPWEWHKPIYEKCRELGVVCFSTPFDHTAVDFLEELGNPIYKIASFENNDLELLKKVAATGKPVIMSSGLTNLQALELSVGTLKEAGCKDLTILKCTSSYPSTPKYSNILTIADMKKRFDCKVGISDHTLGMGAAIASIALGGRVVEKHFTLARSDGGVDAAFSIEPAEMALLVKEVEDARLSLGEVSYDVSDEEKDSLCFKRSLYIVVDMKAGDVISEKNMRAIRPGFGIDPRYYLNIIGKKVCCDISRGTALQLEYIEGVGI